MPRAIAILVLIVAATLAITACQAEPMVVATETALVTMPVTPATLPTFPPEAATANSPTVSPAPDTTPAPTDSPSASVTATVAAPCFVTYSSPIAFTPDGTRILVRAKAGVQVFNLESMNEESFLEAPTDLEMPAVALSPDGAILAWALEDHSIQLVRILDKKLLHTLHGHTDIVGKLRFSPNGDRLFSASHDTWVRTWDMAGNQVGAFQPTGGGGYANEVLGIGIGYDSSDIAFSSDGSLLASADGVEIRIWRVEDGQLMYVGKSACP